jgi:hypothetical protein
VKRTFIALAAMLLTAGISKSQNQNDWMPSVTYPHVQLSSSLKPTEASFGNGAFTDFTAGDVRTLSVRLRNGRYEKRYRPYGSVWLELTSFHRFSITSTVFAVVGYHRISVGGSSSNDCFVDVIAFAEDAPPVLTQQVKFGCDLSGSGSKLSKNAVDLTIRQGYKGDSRLGVVQFRWNGSKYDVVAHTFESLSKVLSY